VTVAAAALLAIVVTTRFLKANSPIVPLHIRRGLTRLYLVVSIPWILWFGYDAYQAAASIRFDISQSRDYITLIDYLDNSAEYGKERIAYARRELGLMAMTWGDAATNDEILKRINKALDVDYDRLTIGTYAVLAGIIPPLLYPIFVWVLMGFRKSVPGAEEARADRP
jgi:hypothetical protein